MGVGESKSVGKIHLYEVTIGNQQYPISMHVMKSSLPEDMIFGIDNLTRLRSVINIFDKSMTLGDQHVKLHTRSKKRKVEVVSNELLQKLGMSREEFENAYELCNGDLNVFKEMFY